MQSTEKNSRRDNERFTAEQGFKFAYELRGKGRTAIVPPEVGSISVSAWEWGYDDNWTYFDSK